MIERESIEELLEIDDEGESDLLQDTETSIESGRVRVRVRVRPENHITTAYRQGTWTGGYSRRSHNGQCTDLPNPNPDPDPDPNTDPPNSKPDPREWQMASESTLILRPRLARYNTGKTDTAREKKMTGIVTWGAIRVGVIERESIEGLVESG